MDHLGLGASSFTDLKSPQRSLLMCPLPTLFVCGKACLPGKPPFSFPHILIAPIPRADSAWMLGYDSEQTGIHPPWRASSQDGKVVISLLIM